MAYQFLGTRHEERLNSYEGEIMKKLFSVLVIGSVLTLLVAGTARAQLPGSVIRAQIPFDFTVRGKTLPAGKYEIRRISDEPVGLLIRNISDKHDKVVFETEPLYIRDMTSRGELVFHRYGDSYFLSEIVTAGENTGEELAPSHAERKMRRELARNQMEPETVTLALN
jgi:hypothetical protein